MQVKILFNGYGLGLELAGQKVAVAETELSGLSMLEECNNTTNSIANCS